MVKILYKNSCIQIKICSNTKIERFLPARHPTTKFRKHSLTTSGVTSKICNSSLSRNGKTSIKNPVSPPCIRIVIYITPKSNKMLLVTHPNLPKISTKFVNNILGYTVDRETDRQRQNHNILSRCNIYYYAHHRTNIGSWCSKHFDVSKAADSQTSF